MREASSSPVPKIIDPVFAKTSPKRSFSMTENERFGLAFANTGSINSGTGRQSALEAGIAPSFFCISVSSPSSKRLT
jgi:hypothetical protein